MHHRSQHRLGRTESDSIQVIHETHLKMALRRIITNLISGPHGNALLFKVHLAHCKLWGNIASTSNFERSRILASKCWKTMPENDVCLRSILPLEIC